MKLIPLVFLAACATVPNPTATAVDSVKLVACIQENANAGKSVLQIADICGGDLITIISTLGDKAPATPAGKEAATVRAAFANPPAASTNPGK